MIHDGMPYDPIKGQGQSHRDPIVAKMADFKVYLLHQYARKQRLMVNHDTPRQYLKFNWTDLNHPRSASRELQTYGVPLLENEFCLLRGVHQQSLMGLTYQHFCFIAVDNNTMSIVHI